MKKKRNDLTDEEIDLSDALGLINEDTILSPELYLHLSIIYAIRATSYGLKYGNFYDSLVERVLMIDQAEKLAIALGLIEDGSNSDYIKEVNEYRKKLEKEQKDGKISERDKLLLDNKVATFKLQKIIEKIAERAPKVGEPIL